jgi:phosphatidylserine/phosphatidylglycerophosphate/cardiolipin synthase-like enzyme
MQRADWFLSGAERGNPATRLDARADGEAWTTGNLVTPLGHGRGYFRRLHDVLSQTSRDDLVLFTDWRGDSDERLAGPGTSIVAVLSALAARGVRVRGLIWRSHPDQTRFSEQENRQFAEPINAAGGQVLLDERVRRAGSHHQKVFVVLHPQAPDADVAFVGGIDLCHGRNDDEHHHGDQQPINIDARYGATPAWHDMQAEVRGRAVDDLAETFRERWTDPAPLNRSLRRRKRPGSVGLDPLPDVQPHQRPAVGPHAVQVLRTYPRKLPPYPFAPDGERSIARAYLKTLRRARRLIYIEDQYFWSMDLARALGDALRRQPQLRVVAVVPKFPDDDGAMSGASNRIGQIRALDHVRTIGGERFAVYDIERDGTPIYVHAKVCIIDDVWMTIGSDNLNRRSWTHDSELSCAILDDTLDEREPLDPAGLGDGARLLARQTRLDLWAEHVEREDLPVDPREGFDLLRSCADGLDRWYTSGRDGARPTGRLRHHIPEPVGGLRAPLARLLYRLVDDPDGRPLGRRARRSY